MLRERDLLSYRGLFQESYSFKALTKDNAKVSIFLSHSHKDKDLVEGFINYLAYSSQIKIYVDWLDSDMPATTTRATAHRIKQKIVQMDYFLVLAIKNAMESKWIPWEIGVADQIKANKIAIVPVADPNGNFHGNEYLQLYPRIMPGHNQISGETILAIFEAREDSGKSVRSWLLE